MSEAPGTEPPRDPPEERLAARLEAAPTTPRRSAAARALHEIAQVDKAVYRAIAGSPTPTLDEPLRRLTNLANNSTLWLGIAGAMFVFGGRAGRRAALTGAAAIAINSALVNIPMKYAADRSRPDREGAGVPEARWVRMPASTSFPSGHAASAFAFSSAVAGTAPAVGVPLRGLAAVVAYSRVHTGVHYPGDVVAGSLLGASIGETTAFVARRLRRRRDVARARASAQV